MCVKRNYSDVVVSGIDAEIRNVYTLDPLSERFFNSLKDGYFMAAFCKNCRFFMLPPKSFCYYCFSYIDTLEEIEPIGKVGAFSKPVVDIKGNKLSENIFVGWIKFPETVGGIVHFIEMPENVKPTHLMQVIAEFKPKKYRKGSLLDIRCFRKMSGVEC